MQLVLNGLYLGESSQTVAVALYWLCEVYNRWSSGAGIDTDSQGGYL